MTKSKRQTAGALQVKASSDTTKYDALEVGQALCDDVMEQLRICAHKNHDVLDIPQFCVVMLVSEDCLIKGLMRRKFYAWPFLPKPRPNQAVFLYTKKTNDISRLWVLPNALTMAILSEMGYVHGKFVTMKRWTDTFYQGIALNDASVFWNYIRKQHGIEMLSETEYLKRHASELIESKTDEFCPIDADSFDFFKGMPQQIVDTKTARCE